MQSDILRKSLFDANTKIFTSLLCPAFPLTRCCPCESRLNSEMWAGSGGEATAGSCPGSGLRPAQQAGPSPAECVMVCLDTAAGRGTCRSLARAKPGCCCCWACWRPTSPEGGRRLAPRSSSSWWIGGPCLCCCRRGGQQGGGESRTTNNVFVLFR